MALASGPVRAGTGVLGTKPKLDVQTMADEDFDLMRQHGHVVVIHFWATWCEPCIKEMPELENFFEHNRARGVEVLALSQDRTRDLDKVHEMMHHMRMRYPVAMSHTASRNDFGEQPALPITFVVDADGTARAAMRPDTNPLTEANLDKIVQPLLSEGATKK